jgi:hypothetical protein
MAVSASSISYSQTYNAPNQAPPARGRQATQYAPKVTVPYVDYNRAPLISQQTYGDVSGYKTPNAYALYNQRPPQQMSAYSNNGRSMAEDDKNVEYYMAFSYGMASFDGKGIANGYTDYPMNNKPSSLGDGRNISFSLGVLSTTDARVEIAYSALSGLSYGKTITAYNQTDLSASSGNEFAYDATERLAVNGGGISSQNVGINLYLPMEEMLGDFLDGLAKPYLGGGIGMAFNTLDDYSVYDEYGYGSTPRDTSGQAYDADGKELFGLYEYDGTMTHFGTTTTTMSWNVEAGLEMQLDKKTKIDLYYKKQSFGAIKSKDYAVASYKTMLILDPVWDGTGWGCAVDGFQVIEGPWCGFELGNAETVVSGVTEKGTIENTELGVRLRMMF